MVPRLFIMGWLPWRRSSWTGPFIRSKSVHRLCPCDQTRRDIKCVQWGLSSRSKSHNPGHDEGGEDEEDFIKDEEVEELFQQQRPAGFGEEDHQVFIVHPDVKWGQKKQHLTTGECDKLSGSVYDPQTSGKSSERF